MKTLENLKICVLRWQHFYDQKVLLLEGTVHPILKRVHSKFGHYKVNFYASSHIKCNKMLLVPLVHVTLQYHVWLAIMIL